MTRKIRRRRKKCGEHSEHVFWLIPLNAKKNAVFSGRLFPLFVATYAHLHTRKRKTLPNWIYLRESKQIDFALYKIIKHFFSVLCVLHSNNIMINPMQTECELCRLLHVVFHLHFISVNICWCCSWKEPSCSSSNNVKCNICHENKCKPFAGEQIYENSLVKANIERNQSKYSWQFETHVGLLLLKILTSKSTK